MALPLALPLAPVISSGASAAAVTFVAGSTVKLIDSIYGFRRPTPTLPPITGLEGVATLRELIGDAIAGARIPVAMPPSPLGPNGSLAAIAATAAAAGVWNGLQSGVSQLWGLLSGQPRTGQTPAVTSGTNNPISGFFVPSGVDANGPFVIGSVVLGPIQGDNRNNLRTVTGKVYPLSQAFATPVMVNASGVPELRYQTWNASIATESGISNGVMLDVGSSPYRASDFTFIVEQLGVTANTPGAINLSAGVTAPATWVGANALLPSLPAYLPATPSISPTQPATQPQPQPETQPQVAPVQPGPSRPAVPAIAPAQPPTIAPWLFPGAIPAAQQTTPAGAVAPLPLPLPQPTPAGNIFPVAGAPPLTEAGPRATIQAIATEVGRIEQKVDRMLNPAPPNNGLDRLGELMALIGRLVEALLSAQSGGSYTMEGPCEVDSSGEPIVDIREVQFPGALTILGVMVNRLDALAVLLQEHKNLKQPTCRKKAPVGEFVTVNFEQI